MASDQLRGHYVVHDEIAAGGMATVHLGRLRGPVGFSRTVAIKQLHANFAKDPEFLAMFVDEARLAARIRHPNVVSTLDVVVERGSVQLVMEYVHGESLARLVRAAHARGERMPPSIAVAIITQVLQGLHAAHEASAEDGTALGIVHRDVSPQNVLVGADGVARVLDFGIAKAALQAHSTRDGQLKGKVAYMAPEQVRGEKLDRRADIFAAGIVLWETLTGARLFFDESPTKMMTDVQTKEVIAPSALAREVPAELDAAVLCALARSPEQRFQSADAFAVALEHALRPATTREVAGWVAHVAGDALSRRAVTVAAVERETSSSPLSAGADEPTARHPKLDETRTDAVPVDVDRPATESRTTRTRLLGAFLLLAALAGSAVAARRFIGPQRAAQPATTATTSPSASVSTTIVAPPAITSVSARIEPSASAPPTGSARVVARVTAPAFARSSTLPDPCVPTFEVLADGTHRFKPECVH